VGGVGVTRADARPYGRKRGDAEGILGVRAGGRSSRGCFAALGRFGTWWDKAEAVFVRIGSDGGALVLVPGVAGEDEVAYATVVGVLVAGGVARVIVAVVGEEVQPL